MKYKYKQLKGIILRMESMLLKCKMAEKVKKIFS